jgi:AcrR family transcriptional regulator
VTAPGSTAARLEAERAAIREAATRLAAGTPQRSNGSLTISALAREAGLSRQRLYEHHADLAASFRATAGTTAVTGLGEQALRRQLDEARERIRELEATEAQLTARLTTLMAIITELTHEASAANIVLLPAGPRNRRRSP